jgi:hypothetical protein
LEGHSSSLDDLSFSSVVENKFKIFIFYSRKHKKMSNSASPRHWSSGPSTPRLPASPAWQRVAQYCQGSSKNQDQCLDAISNLQPSDVSQLLQQSLSQQDGQQMCQMASESSSQISQLLRWSVENALPGVASYCEKNYPGTLTSQDIEQFQNQLCSSSQQY